MIKFYPHIEMFLQCPYFTPQPDWNEWDLISYRDDEERAYIETFRVEWMAEHNAAYRIQRLVRFFFEQRRLRQRRALVLAMAFHPRLGAASPLVELGEDVVRMLV